MAIEVFKLFGSIFVNSDEANKSISKTEKNASGLASKLGSGIKTAAKWGTAIVGAVSAAGAGIMKFAQDAASTADHVDKMSQKIGLSRQAYQELDYICSQSGMSIDKLKDGMKTLRNAMSGDKNAEVFDRLHVSLIDTNGGLRDSESVMWDVMNALQGVADQDEKAILAQRLFGKTSSELMPMLNGASGSIDEMKLKAHELGLVLEDEVIDSGVSLTDTIDKLKRAFSGVVTRLGASLIPIVEKVCNLIIGYMPQIQKLLGKLSPILTDFLGRIFPVLSDLASGVFPQLMALISMLLPVITNLLTALAPIVSNLISLLLPAIVKIIEKLLPPLLRIINALLPLLATVFDLISPILSLILNLAGSLLENLLKALAPVIESLAQFLNKLLKPFIPIIEQICDIIFKLFTPLFEALSPIFTKLLDSSMPLLELFAQLLNDLLPYLIPVIEWLATVLSDVLGTSLNTVFGLLDSFVLILTGIIDFITGICSGDWDKAWKGILSIFWGNFNGIATIAESIVNSVVDLLNSMLSSWSFIFEQLGWGSIRIPKVHLQQDVSVDNNIDFKEKRMAGGRFRSGIDNVPYDRFPAFLDAGEMVLTAHEAESYRKSKKQSEIKETKTQTFNVNISFGDVQMNSDSDIERVAHMVSDIFVSDIMAKGGAYS